MGTPFDALTGIAVQSTTHGDRLWVGAGDSGRVFVLDVNSGAKGMIPTVAQPFSLALAGPHTVALSGFGGTQWLDTTTHRFSHTLSPSNPGYLSGLTGADGGKYTLTSNVNIPGEEKPIPGTMQVIDNTGYKVLRVVSVGTTDGSHHTDHSDDAGHPHPYQNQHQHLDFIRRINRSNHDQYRRDVPYVPAAARYRCRHHRVVRGRRPPAGRRHRRGVRSCPPGPAPATRLTALGQIPKHHLADPHWRHDCPTSGDPLRDLIPPVPDAT